MIEMKAALTDAAVTMVEKMVGALFGRADRTRFDRPLGHAKMLDTARFHARLGRLLVDARATGCDAFRAIDDRVGWDQLERSIRFAEDLRSLLSPGVRHCRTQVGASELPGGNRDLSEPPDYRSILRGSAFNSAPSCG